MELLRGEGEGKSALALANFLIRKCDQSPNKDKVVFLVAATYLPARAHCSLNLLPPSTFIMSSKRKWDQAAPEEDAPAKAPKVEDGKTASEAAAAAAAIAAKIAAQFAGQPGGGSVLGPKDPHDGDFVHDIDINDVRNRYLLTKGSTQTQVRPLTILVVMFPHSYSMFCRYMRKRELQ